MVEVLENGNNVELYTPYSKDFVTSIKSIGGAKWNAGKGCWVIPKEALDFAKDVMLRVYGDNGDADAAETTLTIRVTFNESQYSETWEPYTLMGKTIARATGRDSGAYPCSDVIFEAGKPTSRGSRAKWYAVVPSGCVVRLSNVSPTLWREFNAGEHDGIVAEVCNDKIDAEALRAERERLTNRIKEIDALLEGN